MNYVLYGEERCLLQEAMNKIVMDEVGNSDEMNTVSYNAQNCSIQEILDDAQTIPFFADKKVVIVLNANFLSGNNDTEIDTLPLEKYLENSLASTVLILVGYFPKLDSRKKIVKLVQKRCRILAFQRLDEFGKHRFIKEEINKRNIKINKDALDDLCNRVPSDINTIRNELDKLSIYGKAIKVEDVVALVTRPLEEDVFQMVNAVVRKDLETSFRIWNDLCVLNKDAIFLTALLAGQFRFLYQVKCLQVQGKRESDIVSILKAHPYRVKMSLQSVDYLSINELFSILNQIAQLDQDMKNGKIDKKLGFEMFLIRMQGEY
ncbi:MAG: DNA polymerase III subunit delta [Erysipelotrichaceae bacterium]